MNKAWIWPASFVFLWSTGFIGARYGLPYAEPMTLLAIRFAVATALLLGCGALIIAAQNWARTPLGRAAAWPERAQTPWIALTGLMMHGCYLGAVFAAMSLGLEAGPAAVIAGLSPICTAIGARLFLGEPLGHAKILGMALGFTGVALVMWEKLSAGLGSPAAAALCLLAPIGFAAGALIQKKRLGDMPMISGNMVQYAAAGVVVGGLALTVESNQIEWTGEFIFALAWLVFALSFGAIFLLYYLLRRGEASSVSSLVFLVPSSTALIAWALFGETLGPTALLGFACSALGVALVNGVRVRRARVAATTPKA